MKIAFIPIDNRPVCYNLPKDIAQINSQIELILPDRNLLGSLTKTADVEKILDWLENLDSVDAAIISLDTIAYGGLVSSRRSNDTYEEILNRINKLKHILADKKCTTYAFSSVMRISNNNINEEEKEYWSSYGTQIFEYSYNLHKVENTFDNELSKKCSCILGKIPPEILNDYLKTRKRNFNINQEYINWTREGVLKTLVFSKDDCAQFGLNVKEAEFLEQEAQDCKNVLIKTGADEIPLSLLSRAVTGDKNVKIGPVFLQGEGIDEISNYEDISVFESVQSQIELAGAEIADIYSADLVLYINNFKNNQGEIVMGVYAESYNEVFEPLQKPYFISDILNANGADNGFVNAFFANKIDLNNFYGYSAWNTTGNTIGSAICAALLRFLAVNPNIEAFKKLQTIRFLDDWAYQANVRQKLKADNKSLDTDILKDKMKCYEDIVSENLDFIPKSISYSYPWDRFFEIEVNID